MLRRLGLFRSRRTELRQFHVLLPDGTPRQFDLEARAAVFELLEVSLLSMSVPSSYHSVFGLTAPPSRAENVERTWLNNDKPLKKELKGLPHSALLHLQVLLYPKDHHTIIHPTAKYLLYSQVRNDLKEGRTMCNGYTASKLTGLVAQIELGDANEVVTSTEHLSDLKVVSFMSDNHERAALEQHRISRGLSSEECIDEFLSISETLNGYGSIHFSVQDQMHRTVTLACGPSGIHILMGTIYTSDISWDSIVKINVRGRTLAFHIQSSYNYARNVQSFRCPSSNVCNRRALLCVAMRNHYCRSEVVQPQSSLRRFFSARGSRLQKRPLHSTRSASVRAPASKPREGLVAAAQDSLLKINHGSSTLPASLSKSPEVTEVVPLERESSLSPLGMDMSAIQLLPTVLEHESTTEGSTPPVVDTRQPPSQPSPSQPPPSLAVTLSSSAVDADTNLGTEEACSNHLNHRQDSDSSWTHTRGPSDIDNLESVTILLEEGLDKMARERNSAYFPSSHSQSASAISANRFQTLQYPRRSQTASSRARNLAATSDPFLLKPSLFQSSSRTSNYGSRECVATMEHKQSLLELSQGEGDQFIDPHIRSLVFDSSQADEGTEL